MKKLITFCLISATLLSCTACGNKTSSDNTIPPSNVPEEISTSQSTQSDETVVTLEQLRETPVTDESEFFLNSNSLGGYSVWEYNGDDTILHIPDEYKGKPVNEVNSYIFANIKKKEIIKTTKWYRMVKV